MPPNIFPCAYLMFLHYMSTPLFICVSMRCMEARVIYIYFMHFVRLYILLITGNSL
jgi:hypothetical protein